MDGEPITIACAGVSTDDSDTPDENLLRAIASPECYLHIEEARMLSIFLAEVGSSVASSAAEVAQIMRRLPNMRRMQG